MNTKNVWIFDAVSREYLRSETCYPNPVEVGLFIEPTDSLPMCPPETTANEVAIAGVDAWTVEHDYRGQTWYDIVTGATYLVDILGLPPANFGPMPPLAMQIANARVAQIALINQSCQALITAGQMSSALGSPYKYPSGLTDQQNLSANVVSSLLPGLASTWSTPQICMSADGLWAYIPHSASQIQQVGSDVKSTIMVLLEKCAAYQTEIIAPTITTVAEVRAIVWQ